MLFQLTSHCNWIKALTVATFGALPCPSVEKFNDNLNYLEMVALIWWL